MSLLKQIGSQKLLSFSLLAVTLACGILIGTLVSTGVSAARGQTAAPDATPLVIPPVTRLSNDFTKLAKQLEPSVVYISTDFTPRPQTQSRRRQAPQQEGEAEDNMDLFRRFFGQMPNAPQQPDRRFRREGSGTGFLVDRNGYIITNHHVVERADAIKVKLPGEQSGATYKAKVIGFDGESDIAVIKIDAGRPLQAVRFGNSDSVQVGDWAVAIGAPFGLEATVTAGIVSATGRDLIGAEQFQRFIQTDAAINPGNSGGPLVNINGEVIGVNTMIATRSGGYEGIGFALPGNMAVKVYNSIIQYGTMKRGSIGISFNKVQDPNVMKAFGYDSGVLVTDVTAGGPADKAGLKKDDVILALNGRPVKDGDDLVARIADMPVGSQVKVTFDRDGAKQDKPVTILDRMEVFKDDPRFARFRPEMENPGAKEEISTAKFGIGLKPLTGDWKEQNGYSEPSGVQVTVVEEGSFAEEIGIQEKDIIVSINRKPVNSIEDVRAVQARLKAGDAVGFKIARPIRALAGAQSARTNWGTIYVGGQMPRPE